MAQAQTQRTSNLLRPDRGAWPGDQLLSDYRPLCNLQLPQQLVPRSRFPSIDVHNHLGRWLTDDGDWAVPDVGALVAVMDECNVESVVNLDGLWGAELEANLDRYDRAFPDRFHTFCQIDRGALQSDGFEARLVAGLERSAAAGARGLKVWKDLGLTLRDPSGSLLLPDDQRLDELWAAAARLNLPILIHTADPLAFFQPADHHNERLEELVANPEWHFADSSFPTFERLIQALENVVRNHPDATFIGAHVGCFPENLDWVHRMLMKYPNFNIDISARIAELGRQPRAARRLITAHPDRVLFGTDLVPVNVEEYRIYFRFLETADECFPYSTDEIPMQGRWAISALALGDDVLRQVYSGNAKRLLSLAG